MTVPAPKPHATKSVADLLGIETELDIKLIAAQLRDILLRIDVVCAITGLSVATVYRLMSRDDFPRPLRITSHARAWKLSEVTGWIEDREREVR